MLPPPLAQGALRGVDMRPTDRVLTIDTLSAQPRGRLLGWGFCVNWDTRPLINARAETLTTKPTFAPLLQTRCLVPATAYFEWQHPKGGAKQKMRIHPKGSELFAMAGLIGADGDSVSIVTCPPANDIADIHNRMPVVLAREDESIWMDSAQTFDRVEKLLCPFPYGMSAQNVDQRPALL